MSGDIDQKLDLIEKLVSELEASEESGQQDTVRDWTDRKNAVEFVRSLRRSFLSSGIVPTSVVSNDPPERIYPSETLLGQSPSSWFSYADHLSEENGMSVFFKSDAVAPLSIFDLLDVTYIDDKLCYTARVDIKPFDPVCAVRGIIGFPERTMLEEKPMMLVSIPSIHDLTTITREECILAMPLVPEVDETDPRLYFVQTIQTHSPELWRMMRACDLGNEVNLELFIVPDSTDSACAILYSSRHIQQGEVLAVDSSFAIKIHPGDQTCYSRISELADIFFNSPEAIKGGSDFMSDEKMARTTERLTMRQIHDAVRGMELEQPQPISHESKHNDEWLVWSAPICPASREVDIRKTSARLGCSIGEARCIYNQQTYAVQRCTEERRPYRELDEPGGLISDRSGGNSDGTDEMIQLFHKFGATGPWVLAVTTQLFKETGASDFIRWIDDVKIEDPVFGELWHIGVFEHESLNTEFIDFTSEDSQLFETSVVLGVEAPLLVLLEGNDYGLPTSLRLINEWNVDSRLVIQTRLELFARSKYETDPDSRKILSLFSEKINDWVNDPRVHMPADDDVKNGGAAHNSAKSIVHVADDVQSLIDLLCEKLIMESAAVGAIRGLISRYCISHTNVDLVVELLGEKWKFMANQNRLLLADVPVWACVWIASNEHGFDILGMDPTRIREFAEAIEELFDVACVNGKRAIETSMVCSGAVATVLKDKSAFVNKRQVKFSNRVASGQVVNRSYGHQNSDDTEHVDFGNELYDLTIASVIGTAIGAIALRHAQQETRTYQSSVVNSDIRKLFMSGVNAVTHGKNKGLSPAVSGLISKLDSSFITKHAFRDAISSFKDAGIERLKTVIRRRLPFGQESATSTDNRVTWLLGIHNFIRNSSDASSPTFLRALSHGFDALRDLYIQASAALLALVRKKAVSSKTDLRQFGRFMATIEYFASRFVTHTIETMNLALEYDTEMDTVAEMHQLVPIMFNPVMITAAFDVRPYGWSICGSYSLVSRVHKTSRGLLSQADSFIGPVGEYMFSQVDNAITATVDVDKFGKYWSLLSDDPARPVIIPVFKLTPIEVIAGVLPALFQDGVQTNSHMPVLDQILCMVTDALPHSVRSMDDIAVSFRRVYNELMAGDDAGHSHAVDKKACISMLTFEEMFAHRRFNVTKGEVVRLFWMITTGNAPLWALQCVIN